MCTGDTNKAKALGAFSISKHHTSRMCTTPRPCLHPFGHKASIQDASNKPTSGRLIHVAKLTQRCLDTKIPLVFNTYDASCHPLIGVRPHAEQVSQTRIASSTTSFANLARANAPNQMGRVSGNITRLFINSTEHRSQQFIFGFIPKPLKIRASVFTDLSLRLGSAGRVTLIR
jgi:hypothetical protein